MWNVGGVGENGHGNRIMEFETLTTASKGEFLCGKMGCGGKVSQDVRVEMQRGLLLRIC